MSKIREIQNLVETILSDGEVHDVKEFVSLAESSGIITDKNDHAIKNALYLLKKKNKKVVTIKRGKYQSQDAFVTEEERSLAEAVECVIDEIKTLQNFDLLNCSDKELKAFRKKAAQINLVVGEIKELGCKPH